MDFGAHLPLMDFGGHPYTLDHLVAYTKSGGATRLQCAVGERPHGLLGALARRTGRAGGGDGALGRHDARNDGRARGRARTGGGRQDVGCDRSSVGRSPGRGRRSGLFARRLRGRRSRLRRTLATVRRGDRRAPRAVAHRHVRRSSAVSIRPRVSRWSPGPRNRSDRRSGWGAGAPTPGFVGWPAWPTAGWHRPTTRRRSMFAEAWQSLRSQLPDHGKDPGHVPERARDDVVLHHRRPRRSRPRPQGAGRSDGAPARGDAPRTSPDRPAGAVRREVDGVRRAGVQRVFIWPVADEVHQLERFWNEVRPLVMAP